MSWNFKISWEEYEADMLRKMRKMESLCNVTMYKYYQQYEPMRFEREFTKLMAIEAENQIAEKYDVVMNAADAFISWLEGENKRLGRRIQNSETQRIHVLKAELGMGDSEYRSMLAKYGKSSSTEMVYYEAMLLIRQLYVAKEQKR